MAKYIVEGGSRLSGKIALSGNKNSILPCIAAAILTEEEVVLTNVPAIADVKVMIDLVSALGSEVSYAGNELRVKTPEIRSSVLSSELMAKLRASILLVGPLLARTGKVQFTHPGGDIIGKRTIEPHIQGFKLLGFNFKRNDREYSGYKSPFRKRVTSIFPFEASVTGTENLILATVLGEKEIILKNCAQEPHIVDLCKLLQAMGAQIEGIGTTTLKIRGQKKLSGASFEIGTDFIELGTYAIAAAVTKGEIEMTNCKLQDLEPVIVHLSRMGIVFEEKGNKTVKVSAKTLIPPEEKLHTNIWPGFPPDLMSVAIVLATQAKGISLMHDWMYESRMFFVDKLIGMGANITIADPHRVVIYGPTKLIARDLESPDIRAGMALLLATLIAKGTGVINKAELIERGYENVVEKLTSLGAKIQRVE